VGGKDQASALETKNEERGILLIFRNFNCFTTLVMNIYHLLFYIITTTRHQSHNQEGLVILAAHTLVLVGQVTTWS